MQTTHYSLLTYVSQGAWRSDEYLPSTHSFLRFLLLSYLTHRQSFVFTLYLQEFHASSLCITSGYEPGLLINRNLARTHHNTIISPRPYQLKTNPLPWTFRPAKRISTAANMVRPQDSRLLT